MEKKNYTILGRRQVQDQKNYYIYWEWRSFLTLTQHPETIKKKKKEKKIDKFNII